MRDRIKPLGAYTTTERTIGDKGREEFRMTLKRSGFAGVRRGPPSQKTAFSIVIAVKPSNLI
jgi:hypothetical protein